MPLQIIRQDITKIECDAIVNAANKTLLGGGGVDGAIHRAAGNGLLKECIKLHGCEVGEAKATKGYKLPAKYVIHTVGPKWKGGDNNERELLSLCYKNSLLKAKELGCESIAFPLISTGVYGYPVEEGFNVAVEVISDFLNDCDMLVYLVVFNKSALAAGSKKFSEIDEYIDDNYVEARYDLRYANRDIEAEESVAFNAPDMAPTAPSKAGSGKMEKRGERSDEAAFTGGFEAAQTPKDIFDGIQIDESFSQMLLRKIDEKGMKDSECYKKANIDRKLFSKIRSNPHYKPSKQTAIAFAVALELPLGEFNEMLVKAGYSLSHSFKSDVIIEYFVKKGNYNIFEINEALFMYDQALLGA